MQIHHALADTGHDTDAYADCTCGERVWGYNDDAAYEAFQLHVLIQTKWAREVAALEVQQDARRRGWRFK